MLCGQTKPAAMIVAIVSALASAPSYAGQQITVELTSGRVFTAEVDARTGDDRLWLRYGTDNITLLRPVSWQHVVRAERDGTAVPLDQLREYAESIKSPAPKWTSIDDTKRRLRNEPEFNAGASPVRLSYAAQARDALAFAPRVRSVQFEAQLANWDGDVEADGLILRVYPVDENGRLTPVDGTLEAELNALGGAKFHEVPHGRGQVPVRVARWTRAFAAEDVGPDGLVVKLPFQALAPEFDTDLSSFGLVHVRLVVPGHGTFDDSQDVIRIRPFAPLRDNLERSGHDRFLPNERSGRS